MRRILIAAALVAVAPAAARAEPPPERSASVATVVDLDGVGDRFLLGAGVGASYARRFGPVAVVAEGLAERASVSIDDEAHHVGGFVGRAGLGLRAVPGSAEETMPGERWNALEMRLDAGVDVEAMQWDGGGRLTRPGGWVGVGMQIRQLLRDGRQFVFVLEMRLQLARAWAPADLERAACRGVCTIGDGRGPVDAGWGIVLGAEWGR